MRRRFARAQRLLKPGDFRKVFGAASACRGQYFTLLGLPNDLPWARLGLAVAKRRIAHAVRRNTVKRTVRESFRHHQHQLPGLDIVVVAKAGAAQAAPAQLRRALETQWRKLADLVRA